MRRLLDTDLLIEYLRGRPKAVAYVESLSGEVTISAMTVAELYAGVKGDTEERAIETFLQAFTVRDVSKDVARRAGLLRRDHGPSRGIGLGDAIIAATAEADGATIVTFNARHFSMMPSVEVPYTRGEVSS